MTFISDQGKRLASVQDYCTEGVSFVQVFSIFIPFYL